MSVLERVFVQKTALARHLAAPMLAEREEYVSHLLQLGRSRHMIVEALSAVCSVIPFLGSAEGRAVDERAIDAAIEGWLRCTPRKPQFQHRNVRRIRGVCRGWSRFLGLYTPDRSLLFALQPVFTLFIATIRTNQRYRPTSARSLESPVRTFLTWAAKSHTNLLGLAEADLTAFVSERRSSGVMPRTLIVQCSALRVFFAWAALEGICEPGLAEKVPKIRAPRRSDGKVFPKWSKIRKVIDSLKRDNPSHIRARAVLLLAAVYGLRRAEIGRLTLDDIDWSNEVLTVRRAKGHRVQEFPLIFEIGEALVHYIQAVRPVCPYRNVFISIHKPPRPSNNLGSAMQSLLSVQGLTRPCGLHALRHACATELLRRGTPLRRIADFLGHRNLRSVSIYARSNLRALRTVAEFSLEDVL